MAISDALLEYLNEYEEHSSEIDNNPSDEIEDALSMSFASDSKSKEAEKKPAVKEKQPISKSQIHQQAHSIKRQPTATAELGEQPVIQQQTYQQHAVQQRNQAQQSTPQNSYHQQQQVAQSPIRQTQHQQNTSASTNKRSKLKLNVNKKQDNARQVSPKTKQPHKFIETQSDAEIEALFKSFDESLSDPEEASVESTSTKAAESTSSNSAANIDEFLRLVKEKQAREAAEKLQKQKPKAIQNTFANKPKIDANEYEQRQSYFEEQDEEVINTISSALSKEHKDEEKPSVAELIQQSETCYIDEWMAVYEKGLKSRKTNETAMKIKKGRFRIDSEHRIVILADKRTDGKSADQLLNERWI